MIDVRCAVDLQAGKVGPEIFTDAEVYRQEQERIFGHTWLYVAHESQLPAPGDYLTNYLGEVAVIVVRDPAGHLRVLRNQCVHRGNKVCLFDRGQARSFTCTFHGWQYDTTGALVGVPYYEEAYRGELDRADWGLEAVPRVESYGGLVFASWDPAIVPLAEYLGDLRWYLDRLLVQEHLGGMEVVGGRQRYLMPANWKLQAENFHGDDYHVRVTHASYFQVMSQDAQSYRGKVNLDDRLQVAFGHRGGISHGLGALQVGHESFLNERDLKTAEQLGPEAVEWVHERYRRTVEAQRDDRVKLHLFSNCNVFPNFSIVSAPGALFSTGLLQWHPRGPMQCEVWEWAVVERDAPRIVKEHALRNLMGAQSGAGLLAPDDTENFERSADNLRALNGRARPFHYAMAIGHDEDRDLWQKLRDRGVDVAAMPGLVGPYNWEVNQREFYRCWGELMDSARD